MEKRSDPRIVAEVSVGGRRFAWEEYWEEDDAGFCCPDFVWEMHTRLKVFDEEGRLLHTFAWDSEQREKSLSAQEGKVKAVFCPDFLTKRTLIFDAQTLAVVEEHDEAMTA